jgi:hypothetical protein
MMQYMTATRQILYIAMIAIEYVSVAMTLAVLMTTGIA